MSIGLMDERFTEEGPDEIQQAEELAVLRQHLIRQVGERAARQELPDAFGGSDDR